MKAAEGNGGPGIQLTYTGETQQITIPDGTTIKSILARELIDAA